MSTIKKLFYLGIFYFLCIGITIGQETVFIETLEEGRGVIKIRKGEYFVVFPYHLIENYEGDIRITGAQEVESIGELKRIYGQSDIAIAKIENGGGRQKGSKWRLPKKYDKLVNTKKEDYFLEIREPNGGVLFKDVKISRIDEEILSIKLVDKNDSFEKGMSGSALMNGNKFLGLLLSVKVENGEGSVIRSDVLDSYKFLKDEEFSIRKNRLWLNYISGISSVGLIGIGYWIPGKKSNDLYNSYLEYKEPNLFLANNPEFESRADGLKKAKELQKKGQYLIYSGGAIGIGVLIYNLVKGPIPKKSNSLGSIQLKLNKNAFGIAYNF